ncbi:MAG: penicillin-binding protein 2 [Gammaproteobacteria bacterium]|nr:penicillin-binding protein 2 [Gammaproteobacteria bacterium]
MKLTGHPYRLRRIFLVIALGLGAILLFMRAVQLQVLNHDFLSSQGEARYARVVPVAAHRGMILDRNGEPLAASTPVESVWVNPQEFTATSAQFRELSQLLGTAPDVINSTIYAHASDEFVFIRRQISPEDAQKVLALKIPGLALQREYRRYYPAGEVTAHALGFTDLDDKGQDGLEYAFESVLHGTPGKRKIIRGPHGHVVDEVESLREPEPGRDITLSIDRRLQYLAYRELKAAVQRHGAQAGSAVVLDVQTGEVLAMVNQPAFNPNKREELHGDQTRNRVATDMFEPGSTIKPFTVAAALESGKFRPSSMIDTAPGFFKVGNATVHDIHNYGRIDVSTVLQKSSNVGVSKMALEISAEQVWTVFTRVGLGSKTSAVFPAEAAGVIKNYRQWHEVERVTAAYGYGVSVTALQLVRAYAALADNGRIRPVLFTRADDRAQIVNAGEQVFRPELTAQLRRMLETVSQEGGTGTEARVAGYRVAGKTGTVKKSQEGGYAEHSYLAVFAGFAPMSNPRLAMVVMVDEPQGDAYYGGQVAAPVFSAVMSGALRLLNIAPDGSLTLPARVALLEGGR